MKRTIAFLIVLCMVICLFAGCGTKSAAPATTAAPAPVETAVPETSAPETEAPAEPVELIAFAAASMTEALNQLGQAYMADHPEVSIVFYFDSSGTLKTQIQEGADCDIFISAGQKQMNQLDINAKPESNPDGLDFVKEGTRFNILENKVAMAVPEGNPAGIQSYDDLAAKLGDGKVILAMGNADVPVGQYTQKILAFYQLSEEKLAAAGSVTYGSNVKEVTTQVSEAAVDCGIIYQTDAFSAKLTVVDTATAEMCGQVIYPAVILKASQNADATQAFPPAAAHGADVPELRPVSQHDGAAEYPGRGKSGAG